MRKQIAVLAALALALVSACGPSGETVDSAADVAAAAPGTTEGGDRTQEAARRPPGRDWDRVVRDLDLVTADADQFRIAVTVRTGEVDTIRVFGRPISTRGEQWLIHGPGPAAQEHGKQLGIPTDPFRVRVAPNADDLSRLRELESRLTPPLRDHTIPVPEAMREIDSALAGASGPPAILFPVNGIAVEIPTWTAHEGFLERIHIDAPRGRLGGEVTVIGYYSRSTSPTALELPKKVCVWCGEVEICVPGAGC